MKCIKNVTSGEVTRVSDNIAEIKTKTGAFVYVPKKEWKDKVRLSFVEE